LIRLAAAGPIDCYLSDAPAERTATAVIRAIVPAAKPDRALPISAAPPPTNRHFEIGDKLKLVFFENVQDVEKNKWGIAAGSGFQQHPELTGDYVVQDDGTISVPVLGSFDIVDLSQKEIQNEIGKALDKALGRIGFVTIVSVERPPIYVLGPVKNPGSYTYSQGMTVLHALTLAGGFPKKDVEPWQEMEQVRETAKRYGTLESLAELLTRQAVLRAERDRTTPTTPQRLVELVGPTKAAAMIAAEVDRRSAIVAARNARLQSAADAVKAAQQEVELLSTEGRSLESMDDNIAALKKRAAGIQQLYEKGQLATNNMIIETKTRVADAERNRQDMVIQLAQGKQRLTTAQQEQAKLEADIRGEIETQILALNQQIADVSRENMASEGILGALQVQYQTPAASAITYEIVRQTSKGPVAFVANGMSTLMPGDLVQVSTAEDMADPNLPAAPGQPNSRQAALPASMGCH
jgi:protein involved in polysaccharide export with SLBB domain